MHAPAAGPHNARMTGGSTRDLAAAKLRLDALVDWERRARSGMRPQLEPVRDLCQRLGDPQTRWRCVHVTGTKGKGSTAHLIANALQRAGWRTGLYTSPHVERVQERIRIQGVEVSDEVMASALHRALDAREDALRAQTPADDATWFDVLTAAAYLVYAEESCAWVVLEVGLGGRLDSTNVATGEVCVVTNVELEHCDVLGPTRAAIAREKVGIVKPSSSLVTSLPAEDEAGAVLAQVCAELGVPRIVVPMPAGWRQRNAALARAVLAELVRRDPALGAQLVAVGEAVDAAGVEPLPGRGEWRQVGPTRVYLDGVHVAPALRLALDEVTQAHGRPAAVVLALGKDKDAPAVLKAAGASADVLLCTTASSGPLRSADDLQAAARAAGYAAHAVQDPLEALQQALALAGASGWVCVVGSFHLVGIVRRATAAIDPKDQSCSPSSRTCS